jgi:hypothetical protein
MAFYPHNFSSGAPADPAAITNAAYKMAGLGAVAAPNAWAITPQITGRVFIMISGTQTHGWAGTGTLQLSFGTGAAPANAAAVTGTQQGGQMVFVSDAGTLQAPFAMSMIITGQAIGTALWFDVNQKHSASSLQLQFLNVLAIEI